MNALAASEDIGQIIVEAGSENEGKVLGRSKAFWAS
jgi:hypothetical protein